MPTLARLKARAAAPRPSSIPRYSPRMSQCSVPSTRTGVFANRCASCRPSWPRPPWPTMTRPPDAPRSTAATATVPAAPAGAAPAGAASADAPPILMTSAQERGGHARVHRDVQPGGQGQVAGGQRDHRGGDVLGQHLPLEQGPLRVERAELLLGHPVHRGALGAPPARKDAGAADHPVRVDPVHPDAGPAQFGGEQPDLVLLVRLGPP